jgi:hypothetical protein
MQKMCSSARCDFLDVHGFRGGDDDAQIAGFRQCAAVVAGEAYGSEAHLLRKVGGLENVPWSCRRWRCRGRCRRVETECFDLTFEDVIEGKVIANGRR